MTSKLKRAWSPLLLSSALVACNSGDESVAGAAEPRDQEVADISPVDRTAFEEERIATFDEPWAMDFMPGTQMLFVTEKGGNIVFLDLASGRRGTVESGVPEVDYGGQGGLGDIAFAPDWPEDETSGGTIYLSWAEAGEGRTRGAAVGRGTLICEQADSCRITGLDVIWRQQPKVTGRGHYGHRIAFSPDGEYIFISSGDRQKLEPAQNMNDTLGTIVRLNLDGSVPDDNPFAEEESPTDEIWSLGHRNPLGLAFDDNGNLWSTEMGPKGGDELNIIRRGHNYAWPELSDGTHYDDRPIEDHPPFGEENENEKVPGSEFGYTSPKISWVPAISPANLMFYNGALFPEWQGSLFIGGLSGQTLIRVELDDQRAEVANRWPMGERIREVIEGPQGAIWLLTDGRKSRDKKGELIKLTPPNGEED